MNEEEEKKQNLISQTVKGIDELELPQSQSEIQRIQKAINQGLYEVGVPWKNDYADRVKQIVDAYREKSDLHQLMIEECNKLKRRNQALKEERREKAQEPSTWSTAWRTTGFVAAVFILLRWSIVTTHCVVEYNGGRVLQCSYEVLFQEIPDKW